MTEFVPEPTQVSHHATTPDCGVAPPPSILTRDSLITQFQHLNPPPDSSLMGYTENGSATFMSSGNPCLDFFFHIVPDTPLDIINERLKLSWDHDSLKTLKLICNLRGVRGTGKSDKESFYKAALWLHENHPKTLACNLKIFAQFGYFKDLPEILYRIFEGPDIRQERKSAWRSNKKGKGRIRMFYFLAKKNNKDDDPTQAEEKRLLRASIPREKRVEANMIKVKEEMEKARKVRHAKILDMAKRATEKYDQDENYRFLHDQISRFFADLLKSDLQALHLGETNKISLAAKWCPTIDSSYDKTTLLCKSIAKMMFPRQSSPEYETIGEDQYIYRVRNKLRKEVLVPLHQALKLPEVYMTAKEWGSIKYERVGSVAMRKYTDIFLHRDNKRFRGYLENVKAGNAKITAGALFPHEIIQNNRKGSSGAALVSELQWKRMVDDLSKKGKLTNCLAVCDVSGSMEGTPTEVSVALGLMVSELSEEPWKGHVISFSAEPQFHLIKPGNLRSKTEFIKKMDFGYNTDFQKVFDKILEVAVKGQLSEDKMIKRLFVFSDMEFDQASNNLWETDYMVIQRKFREKGYQNVPEIVFWNLRDSLATVVKANQNGVALVSGFSKNLLTLFLEEGGEIKPEDVSDLGDGGEVNQELSKEEMNPEATMESAISDELYDKLVVYD
ncbi:hypothetical protein BUALT_Bualt14G0113200 [Buddleja alternifolia]|uniref:DUF2828 domain-containing protein n=1 Tax=Buddleja alternifolia TaxID=168488 RepID=A0AAV6WQ76_9LAMI|nr:hypothetical protein BUALT_Bualt14G0113200 [Buddleja alternifolia]